MALSISRKVTDQDYEKIEQAAQRFCKRHNITIEEAPLHEFYKNYPAYNTVEKYVTAFGYDLENKRLFYPWQRAFCRALGYKYSKDLCIAWGYIGHSVA